MSLDFRRYHGHITYSGTTKGFVYAKEPEQRTSVGLQPVKQDTGRNPYELRAEIGDWFAQGDFSHGQGQQFFHRPGSDYRKFYYADGFDIGHIRKSGNNIDLHLVHCKKNGGILNPTGGYALNRLVVANGTIFALNGTSGGFVVRFDDLTDTTPVAEDARAGEGGSPDHTNIATDGTRVFVAFGGTTGVHIRDSAGVWDHWQPNGTVDLNVTQPTALLWHRERLFVSGQVGGTGSARALYEVVTSSTPAATDTLPAGWTIRTIWTNGHWVYASCENGSEAEIRHYEYNSATGAFALAGITPMFQGEYIYCATAPGGHMVLGGGRSVGGDLVALLYRAIPDDAGFLQLVKIAEGPYTSGRQDQVRVMTHMGGFIICSWPIGSSGDFGRRYGLGVYDVARDAFSLYMQEGSLAGDSPVHGVAVYQGKVIWHNAGDDLYYEDFTKYATTATFISSLGDWNSPGSVKQWDRFELAHAPLATGESVAIYYSTKHPSKNTWTLVGTSNTVGAEGATFAITPVEARQLAVKLVSTAATSETSAPEITGFSVRSSLSTPDAQREYVFSRKILLKQEIQKSRRAEPKLMAPRTERDWLEDLLFKTITLAEPDEVWTCRVEQVQTVQKSEPNYTHDEQAHEEWEVTLVLRGVKA